MLPSYALEKYLPWTSRLCWWRPADVNIEGERHGGRMPEEIGLIFIDKHIDPQRRVRQPNKHQSSGNIKTTTEAKCQLLLQQQLHHCLYFCIPITMEKKRIFTIGDRTVLTNSELCALWKTLDIKFREDGGQGKWTNWGGKRIWSYPLIPQP